MADSSTKYKSVAERISTHVLGSKYNGYSYSYLIDRARPLDLLLWRGEDFISNTIRHFSDKAVGNGDFSHAGMLVTRDILPSVTEMKKDRLYVWEATMSYPLCGITDGVPNIETGEGKFGIQIRDLEEVVQAYVADSDDTALGWARLSYNPWVRGRDERKDDAMKRRKEIVRKIRQLHEHLTNRPFERNPLSVLGVLMPSVRPARDLVESGINTISFTSEEAIKDIVDFVRAPLQRNRSLSKKLIKRRKEVKKRVARHEKINVKETGSMETLDRPGSKYLFCSEMVAIIYIELGIMDRKINPENVLPIYMVEEGMYKVAERPILIFPK